MLCSQRRLTVFYRPWVLLLDFRPLPKQHNREPPRIRPPNTNTPDNTSGDKHAALGGNNPDQTCWGVYILQHFEVAYREFGGRGHCLQRDFDGGVC